MKINYYAEATETLDAVELTSDGDVDGYFIMPRVGEKICLRDNDENEFYLKVVDIIHHHGKGLGFIDIDCKQLENFDKLFDL